MGRDTKYHFLESIWILLQVLLKASMAKCKCNVDVYSLISREFSRLYNLHPWYWNAVLYGLISSGENSTHFLKLMPFTIFQFLFHQVPITAEWAEALWNEKFAQYFYTWPALGIEPQTFWTWVQHLIHFGYWLCITILCIWWCTCFPKYPDVNTDTASIYEWYGHFRIYWKSIQILVWVHWK